MALEETLVALEALEELNKQYIPDIERELLTKIRLGDRKAVSIIFQSYCCNLTSFLCCKEIVRLQTLEMLMLICREVRELGGPPYEILDISNNLLSNIADDSLKSEDMDNFCSRIEKEVIDKYMEIVIRRNSKQGNIIIDNAIKFIKANYHKDIQLVQIADAAFVSSYYLSHLFPKATGKTIMEYITAERIEAAKKLLIENNLPIKNIASKTGFTGVSYFSKIFKKFSDMTPGEFRTYHQSF